MEESHVCSEIIRCSSDSDQFPQLPNKYKEKISSLPQHPGWTRGVGPDLYLYQGFWCYSFFLEGVMKAQDHFQAQPSDIILCSAPKTGTTWLKALTFAVATRCHFDLSPLLTAVPHDCVPFLEVDAVQDSFPRNPNLSLLATHVPYAGLPDSIMSSKCKIVYICREPKDAFVSLWHFVCRLAPEGGDHLPLPEAVDMFCRGISNYGPYWDHVLGFWKASLECPDRVLFLKYEDLKRDTLRYVKILAHFMGCPFSMDEEEENVVEKIMGLCSFETLSNLEVNKTGKHRAATPLPIRNNVYFRKGGVGDWKNHLTHEMADRIDQITQQKFGANGLVFLQP